ncbi:MAG: hypothetical protein GY934_16040 [Gammaproteobacteria bacterium]|nr:hypothetical protein [Gammaproteobacteria bacterium]
MVSDYRDAMLDAGLIPPQYITPGKINRFPGADKKQSNTAGWCMLFDDLAGGVFGDWSTGLQVVWQASSAKKISQHERHRLDNSIAAARQQRRQEQDQQHQDASKRSMELWGLSREPLWHQYLKRKRVLPLGIHQKDQLLLVPVRDINGRLWSIQTINQDGEKRFLKGGRVKGCFYLIGGHISDEVVIAEGFATGASLHQHNPRPDIHTKGKTVAVAFNTKNLKPVAEVIALRYPLVQITIAADNDSQTEGNPGLTAGREAAAAVDGQLIYPVFDGKPFGGTDFNDLINGGAK